MGAGTKHRHTLQGNWASYLASNKDQRGGLQQQRLHSQCTRRLWIALPNPYLAEASEVAVKLEVML
jgi:hypothetical protein